MGEPAKTGLVKFEKPVVLKKQKSVTIKNPKPSGGGGTEAVQGKKFDPTAYGIRKALIALNLKNLLSGVPHKGVSGKMLVTFTIGKNGKITEVKCEGEGKGFHLTDSAKLPFKRLAKEIAGALANLQFKPGEKAQVQLPLEFKLTCS